MQTKPTLPFPACRRRHGGLIDRPATLPTGADSIRDVILCPHMKIKR